MNEQMINHLLLKAQCRVPSVGTLSSEDAEPQKHIPGAALQVRKLQTQACTIEDRQMHSVQNDTNTSQVQLHKSKASNTSMHNWRQTNAHHQKQTTTKMRMHAQSQFRKNNTCNWHKQTNAAVWLEYVHKIATNLTKTEEHQCAITCNCRRSRSSHTKLTPFGPHRFTKQTEREIQNATKSMSFNDMINDSHWTYMHTENAKRETQHRFTSNTEHENAQRAKLTTRTSSKHDIGHV